VTFDGAVCRGTFKEDQMKGYRHTRNAEFDFTAIGETINSKPIGRRTSYFANGSIDNQVWENGRLTETRAVNSPKEAWFGTG